jgi:hypothetical protein
MAFRAAHIILAVSVGFVALFVILISVQHNFSIRRRVLLTADKEAYRVEAFYHKITASDIYSDKRLLYNALKALNGTDKDLILFKGQRTPEAFDLENKMPHAVFNVSIQFTSWRHMAAMVNSTARRAPENKAVHVHNQNMPLSHFMMNIIRDTGLPRPFPSRPMDISPEVWQKTIDQGQPPIVITNQVDENYGWLSTFIRNRTVNWGNLTKDLNDQCSDYNSVHRFLASSKILLIVASSHVDPQIGFHEKIISLPLGVNVKETAFLKVCMYILAITMQPYSLI